MATRTGMGIVSGQHVDPEKLRRAREFRRGMTPEEATLWHRLRNNRLDGRSFRRQQVIDGFIADFFCAQAGLVVEVDGAVHRQQTGYDAGRDHILMARGLRVLRLTNDEVRHRLPTALQRIRDACTLPCEDVKTAVNLPSPASSTDA